ncbi:hypothetical protein LF1_42410 [Rubripirellula obstinata]|uniref:Methyltransferase domain protein n=1 Tax=Rubripirellula obstinata TaxID=406547 RepID=A0A5B1CMB5_9BACT|nr:hypothetical protein [Rubripirellula obstinata]KAA1261686.1 hypothetical protein LF1_42410 [Rubripirellula obstinata]
MLTKIPIPSAVDAREIPPWVREAIQRDEHRIEAFQDQWDRPQIEQFVAADFCHVYQSLDWILETQLTIGKRFLEWGCGFAVVTALASSLQLDAIGIEAESELIRHGRETLRHWDRGGELIEGNFLPAGSESLADDPWLPSVGHAAAPAYEKLGLDLDDFAIVYSYPWPGEDDFHEAVFEASAVPGALLLMFCGPNDLRLYRRRPNR